MSRIASTFAQLGSQKALIAYITAGDPNLATTLAMMHSMAENGADIIELGIPFSDPMADGPTIQRAVERALAQHVSLRDVLATVKQFRQSNTQTPVVLMGYLNPVHKMGYEAFAQAAARNGVGTLVLVSAAQANADSRFFYMRMKGQLENAVRALPFAKTVILRPPMLVRDHSDRPSEILTVKLLHGLNAIGLLRSQKPMPTETLARAMCQAAAEFPQGVHILEAADIWQAAL